MEINVVGLGYIGLPTALMMAANGLKVVGTDVDKKRIKSLNNREVVFEEKLLYDLFLCAVDQGIAFSTEKVSADIYIISVPTPYIKESKKIDASYVMDAVGEVAEICPPGGILVIESTIPPGTIDRFVRPLLEAKGLNPGEDIHIVHAPERIIPGNMIFELENNSRTIGADDRKIGKIVKEIYGTFCKGEIVITDIRTAEMTKVVENTYRDINIAFANELMKLCHQAGLNVYEIIKIANMHPRVNILSPGPGVGGHCISVDPWFLVGDYPGLANIILAARKINDSMPGFVLERLAGIMDEHGISDISRIGLYGLTYKEDVDDVRESPTIQLLECMRKHLAQGVKIYDPYIKDDMVSNQYHNLDLFLQDSDIIVVLVGHKEIIQNQKKLLGKIILDTKNVLEIDRYLL